MQKMWKTLKNICPNQKPILPAAKKNHQGKIVSSKNDIKNLLAKEYKNRLRSRPYRHDMIETKSRRKRLFDLKLKSAENKKSQPWTNSDLEKDNSLLPPCSWSDSTPHDSSSIDLSI